MTPRIALLALFFAGCIPAGGGGGSDDDDGGPVVDGFIDPDDGVPPPDRGVDPDAGLDPDDGVPPPDRGVDPDDGVPPPDRGVAPDRGVDPDDGVACDGPETCNGRDDDCDGRTDEDFPELGQDCSVGRGVCRMDSVLVCDPRGGTICDAVLLPGDVEACNGLDDDCDGRTDEEVVTGACDTGEPGACDTGEELCADGEMLCVALAEPRDERCNEVDDDCDGVIDEDTCVEPVEVTCDDGLDNDGDGLIDCRDFDCDDLEICADQVERCDNGVDDDDDGFVDCADFNCDDHPACQPVVAPECQGYVELGQATRNAAFNDGEDGVTVCERDAGEVVAGRWHRFVGEAGAQMATEAPATYACGTHAPGWLNGAHPRVEDGIVQREACFHFFGDTCWQNAQVRVRNCGPFYVYELPIPNACSVRYCGVGAGAPVDPPAPADRVAGVQRDVPVADVAARGWVPCYTSDYGSPSAPFGVLTAGCAADEVMLACGRVGSNTLTLAAEGDFDEVFFDIGDIDATRGHNGVEWYYAPARSFGFAPGGAVVSLNTCDTQRGATRMCVHLDDNDMVSLGYRCGDNDLNGDAAWHRTIYRRDVR